MAGITLTAAFGGFINPGMSLCHLSEHCNKIIALVSEQRDIESHRNALC